MYKVIKRMEISAAHQLDLPYESKCKNLHGHNWIVDVEISAEELTNGMVFDFTHIKKHVHNTLDHQNVNTIITQPTAENMAKWIYDRLETILCDLMENDDISESVHVTKITVQESEGNVACYIP